MIVFMNYFKTNLILLLLFQASFFAFSKAPKQYKNLNEAIKKRHPEYKFALETPQRYPRLFDLRVNSINETVNKNEFMSDELQFNQEDFWQDTVEFLSQKKGDCEDFAIAKFSILLAMGVPMERLHLAYVKHKTRGAHMVLLYDDYASDKMLVLDNLTDKIVPLEKSNNLELQFYFNELEFHSSIYGNYECKKRSSPRFCKMFSEVIKTQKTKSFLMVTNDVIELVNKPFSFLSPIRNTCVKGVRPNFLGCVQVENSDREDSSKSEQRYSARPQKGNNASLK